MENSIYQLKISKKTIYLAKEKSEKTLGSPAIFILQSKTELLEFIAEKYLGEQKDNKFI